MTYPSADKSQILSVDTFTFFFHWTQSLQCLQRRKTAEIVRCRVYYRSNISIQHHLTLLLPEAIIETCNVVPTCESLDEILWCDHSSEISLHYFRMVLFALRNLKKQKQKQKQNEIKHFLEFLLRSLLGVKGLTLLNSTY